MTSAPAELWSRHVNLAVKEFMDLAVLVPSRGRPERAARLIRACERTCTARTRLYFGLDSDDPMLPKYWAEFGTSPMVQWDVAERMNLSGWTNRLAWRVLDTYRDEAPYLASIGDDMIPRTVGWDAMLIKANAEMGGGFTYPADGRRSDVPEAVVIDARIVRALGWMCEPSIHHWYLDNVWRDLGAGAGCLKYVPVAVVDHKHPNVRGGDPPDATYWDAATQYDRDLAAYQQWRLRRRAQDVRAVQGIRAPSSDV